MADLDVVVELFQRRPTGDGEILLNLHLERRPLEVTGQKLAVRAEFAGSTREEQPFVNLRVVAHGHERVRDGPGTDDVKTRQCSGSLGFSPFLPV